MERAAQCACKNVTVVVTGDPQMCFACHCDYCQRATGSIGTFGAVFQEQDVKTLDGETIINDDFPNWPGLEKHFCAKCGTTVHWINPTVFPGMRMVAVGCFADPDFPGPDMVVQTQYRHKWCGSFDGATEHEAFPS